MRGKAKRKTDEVKQREDKGKKRLRENEKKMQKGIIKGECEEAVKADGICCQNEHFSYFSITRNR